MRSIILPIVMAAFCTGCAGSLQVFDAKSQEVAGVPFNVPEVYVKEGFHDKASKGGACIEAKFVEEVSLPTGSLYYVKAKTAALAKTAFHIKYGDNGAVSEIGLDSEPAGGDVIDAIKGLAVAAGLGGDGAAAAAGGGPASPPACDSGQKGVTYTRFSEYPKK